MTMPDEPEPKADESVEPIPPEVTPSSEEEQDIGDFITRHVLEKDSVFFEG